MPDYRFTFAYTPDELREAGRQARRRTRTRSRLLRMLLMVLLFGAAPLFGFVMAPYELGPTSFDHEMSISAMCFFAAGAGVLGERLAAMIGLRALLRPWRLVHAAERSLAVGPDGVTESVGPRRLHLAWSPAVQVHRGRTLLTVSTDTGEWLGLPVRLLPDAAGLATLERDIAGWRRATLAAAA